MALIVCVANFPAAAPEGAEVVAPAGGAAISAQLPPSRHHAGDTGCFGFALFCRSVVRRGNVLVDWSAGSRLAWMGWQNPAGLRQ